MTTEIEKKFQEIKKLKNKKRSWDSFVFGRM